MTNALAIYDQFDQVQNAAIALHKSGYFADVKSEAQAIVKVMAGAELGIPPFASMSGIHIIQGKPVLGANVIATLVKNDPRYDYRVKQCDGEACTIEWLENGKSVGEAGFTIQEAQNAGLTGKDNWKKWTSDMLFARAISRGARRFAPGIFGGAPVYTPDELGADTDEDGYIIAEVRDVTPKPTRQAQTPAAEVAPKPKVENGNGTAARPYTPDKLYALLKERAEHYEKAGATVTEQDRNILAAAVNTIFNGDDTQRYELFKWLAGEASAKKISAAYVIAMKNEWLKATTFGADPDPMAAREARIALAEALKAAGQEEMF